MNVINVSGSYLQRSLGRLPCNHQRTNWLTNFPDSKPNGNMSITCVQVLYYFHLWLRTPTWISEAACRVLQEFRDAILKVAPVAGRELRCEIVEDFWDWQSFLEPANVHLTGVTIQHQMESVNHGFRFMKRSDLKFYKGNDPHLRFLGRGHPRNHYHAVCNIYLFISQCLSRVINWRSCFLLWNLTQR